MVPALLAVKTVHYQYNVIAIHPIMRIQQITNASVFELNKS
jgi:hypothetical protein